MEEFRERQENEFEVIQAIYLDEVKDLRQGGGFKWEPLVFSVQLEPQRGSSHPSREQQLPTTVRLTVRLPRNYPNIPPELTIGDVKGLNNQEVAELKDELNNLAKEIIGEVMILELIRHTETFLYTHQKLPTGSFYDEMLMRKKLQEEKITERQQIFREKERLAIQEEILKKQEALKEEERLLKEQRKLQIEGVQGAAIATNAERQNSPIKERPSDIITTRKRGLSHRRRQSGNYRKDSEESDSSLSESSSLFSLEVSCQKELRTFHRGEGLGKSSTGRIMYAGMDSKTGSLVAISEWKLNARVDKKNKTKDKELLDKRESLDEIVKHISSFENEFRVLQKLVHPNIVEYYGMKLVPSPESGHVFLYVVEEFVRGGNLNSYLQDIVSLDLSLVRHCAQGILKGLEYLHSNNVVHRFMRTTSVYFDAKGSVKIGDYGLERKMYDILHACNENVQLNDQLSPSIGRGAKKCDIYRAGVIILSLLNGHVVTENPPQIPSSLPPELQDFLRKFMTTDEHARWTASQLLEHIFLKLPMEKRKFDHLVEREKIENLPDDSDEVETQGFMSQVVKGHSRLQSEFEVLLWLGKGGFGDVVKVRNKLDGGIYALKRIRLNPRNKLLNKKITREVKLLSRLNHENVVRYFNSWIETVVEDPGETTTSTETTNPTTTTGQTSPKKSAQVVRFKEDPIMQPNSLGFEDNIEALAPPADGQDSNWSVSGLVSPDADDESDECSSEDEDIFGTSFICLDEQSEDVIFESDSNTQSSRGLSLKNEFIEAKNEDSKEAGNVESPSSALQREAKYMYIQMEFCEKSTLRTAIDGGLYEELDRAWRLFREIVEGLVHIHQQGMIHRDLKPVNIFLDSNDHVKIGDFGLATSNVLQRGTGDVSILIERPESVKLDEAHSVDYGDESMTGRVGTALYVAPELCVIGTKSTYNQKVDIYSLGIIFFEMFYHPPATNMERVRAIHGLRQVEIIFPSDFEEKLLPQQTQIAKWLLNHDPSQRPTSFELLQSDLLPPLEMEERELQEVFRHTLSNPQSKAYKYLIQSCFKQNISAAEDITYDMDTRAVRPDGKLLAIRQRVKHIISGIFEKHGALELNTPLLLPKSKSYQRIETTVQVMTHGGSVVTIPHDTRIPFARYAVSNSLTNVKRYAIEKVFRERKVHGFHPRELYECAFDIISSSKVSLLADAEVISVVFEILGELPWLRDLNCTIRLGHTFILDAIFIHFGIDAKFHSEIKAILTDVKSEKHSKSQVQTHLVSLCLPEQFISHLFALMEIEGPVNKLSIFLKGILKRKGEAASLLKEALHDLEVLETHFEAFGIKSNVVCSPCMIFGSNIYSGLTFQIICHLKRRNRLVMDVLAAGGRYDPLLEKFRSTLEAIGVTKGTKQFGVGVSISFDKLMPGSELQEAEKFRGGGRIVEVAICSMGYPVVQTKEKISIMKDFWSHGISCTCLDGVETMEAAEEFCRELGSSFLIVLKDSELHSALRVRIFEKERINERKIPRAELIELVKKNWRNSLEGGELHGSSSSSALSAKGSIEGYKGSSSNDGAFNAPNHPTHTSNTNNTPSVNISFLFPENKDKNSNWKRRTENQMVSHIGESLSKLSKQHTVELLGIEANGTLIKTLGSYLHIYDKEQYNRSVAEILDKHPRQKYVKAICDEIFDLVFEKNASVIVIFGLLDNSYKVLL